METRICKDCGNKYPLTQKYFRTNSKIYKGKVYRLHRCRKCENIRVVKYNSTPERKIRIKELANKRYNSPKTTATREKYRKKRIELRRMPKAVKAAKKYRKKNKKNIAEYHKKYNSQIHVIEKAKIRSSKNVATISDSFVAACIGVPKNNLVPEVIETKRLIIQINREIKKIENGNGKRS